MSKHKVIFIAFLATSMLSVYSSGFSQGNTTSDAAMQAQKSWREAIRQVSLPKKGACYHASYPSTDWKEVNCTVAPNRPFAQWLPSQGKSKNAMATASNNAQTVGNGNDYAAQVPGLLSLAVGQFSSISGVTSETGYDGANDYSLQLNSNIMNSAACNGHSGCLAWQQYVYSSGEQALFIQYWLLNYGTCPSGWNTYLDDCWKNSTAVQVPTIPIADLTSVSLWGGAGTDSDSLLLTTPIAAWNAYSFSTPTSVLDIATGWNKAEYNIFGDGGGSAATFNSGSSVTVDIQLREQGTSQTTPTCIANAGTTAETNNLTLTGSCTTGILSNSNPYISFNESN